MELTDKQIKHIAEELQMGMKCYVHRESGKAISFPDPNRLMATDDEYWQEQITEIDAHPDDYQEIDPMSSHRSFEVMEEFAEELTPGAFRTRLLDVLGRAKPFRHFKYEIEGSEYREQWFAFRDQEMTEWVGKQL
ncbi:UPF0158 family protein [Persicitalea sp.]|uniref:UPF0158 family protein n=1 Tax=Persicitalea sp. TaxID=3100273 RepID=UPI00359459BB